MVTLSELRWRPDMALPVVAIVGRPNVGKSTLLNRILGRREAIVEQRPGVTRDRKEVVVDWAGRPFQLVDTGGWSARGDQLDDKVSRQSERAIEEADAILLVVDTTTGITEGDDQVAALLRRAEVPVFVVANKVDDSGREPTIWEFMRLGLGEPWPVSALHGLGAADLLDALVEVLPEADGTVAEVRGLGDRSAHAADGRADGRSGWVDGDGEVGDITGSSVVDESAVDESAVHETAADAGVFSVALVGRPNVGKSTLFNRLIGDDRSVVHDVAGTTRDSIDTVAETDQGPIRFVDTAGLRRKGKIDEDTERYSAVRALKSVDDADVALLVVDATVGVTHQDQRLAERVDAAGCPIVVLLNKWELLDSEGREDVQRQIGDRLHFLADSPVLKISALTGKGVHRLLPALGAAFEDYQRRVPTARVNDAIRRAQARQPAPAGARVLYAIQGAAHPPTFTLFANKTIPPTYLRYLERQLREELELGSTPVKLRVRRRSG